MKYRIISAITAISTIFFFMCGANLLAKTQTGRMERITVHGKSLEGNLEGDAPDRRVSIYLPSSYDKERSKRYPVVYILHGFGSNDDHWFGIGERAYVNIPEAADRSFANGIKEMILVMPNAFTKYQGSMYSSSVTTGDWETFVALDLVNYMDSHYRTIADRSSRGLAGHSMGGYGTIRIGMKYPGVFSSMYSLSPCCMGASLKPQADIMAKAAAVKNDEDIKSADFGTQAMLASAAAWSPNPQKPPRYFDLPVEGGELRPEVVASWAANAPLAMVHQYIPELKKYKAIAVDAGDKDTMIAPTVVSLDNILKSYGIRHFSEIYDGDHVNRIAERLESKVLPFFSDNLSFE